FRLGDSIALNDSYLAGGHFPDFFVVSPVFRAQELIGFVVNSAHHVDVGGAAAGSQRVQGVTEAFQEAIRMLPVRIARNGSVDENILRLLLGNVRLPRKMEGDLRAQMNANHVGQARLVALYDSYGRSVVEGAIDTIIEHSERIARDIIRKLPDG